MGFVDIGSTTLHYELKRASGPLLVLVHEMGGTLESWDAVLPLLDDGLGTLRFDMRGAGMSGKVRDALCFADMSDDLLGLLDMVAPGEAVFLAGCAVGGGIALDFASRHPDLVLGVVAMAPATSVPKVKRESVASLIADIERSGIVSMVDRAVAKAFPEELDISPDILDQYRSMWLGNDPKSYADIYRMVLNSTLEDRLRQIDAPVLLVAGELDETRPPALVSRLCDLIPKADFATIRSGHYMPVQAPGAVADLLNRFCMSALPADTGDAVHAVAR